MGFDLITWGEAKTKDGEYFRKEGKWKINK